MRKTRMKNFFKSAVACMLALMTFFVTACRKEKEDESIGVGSSLLSLDTLHGGTFEETDEYIIKDSTTDYAIIVSENASVKEEKAAAIIQTYTLEATGCVVPIYKDSALTWNENIKTISIGKTSLSEAANVSYDYDKQSASGFQIKTIGKSIFLVGGVRGVLYSAYELLWYWFHFDYYAAQCYSIDTNVTQLKLHNFNVTEIPDFEDRVSMLLASIREGHDPMLEDALRLTDDTVTGYVKSIHNTLNYVPWSEYGENGTIEQHPEWFMDKFWAEAGVPYQLCFSSSALEDDGFVPIVVERIKETVLSLNDPTKIISFVHEDHSFSCDCENCVALEQKYGTASAAYILVLNKIAKAIGEWSQETLGYTVKVAGMGYSCFHLPPVKWNANEGKYEPVDEKLKFEPNLCMIFAPLTANFGLSFDEPANKEFFDKLEGWAALSDNLLMWTYPSQYGNYFAFYDTFEAMQKNYQLFYKNNVNYVLPLGNWDDYNASGFFILKAYLESKLLWDCQANVDELIDRFFNNYFEEAATPMRKIFDSLMSRTEYMRATVSSSVTNLSKEMYLKMYPLSYVNTLMNSIDTAYACIDGLKVSQPNRYKKIYNRITSESLSFRYWQIYLHSSSYTDKQIIEMKANFFADCETVGIVKIGEGWKISDLQIEWG